MFMVWCESDTTFPPVAFECPPRWVSFSAMENVDVVATPAGMPVSFVRQGRTWVVGAEPMRWYERVAWWETTQRMPRGQHVRIDSEVWQVQARIGHNPRMPLVSFELVCGQDRTTWSIRSMEAVAA